MIPSAFFMLWEGLFILLSCSFFFFFFYCIQQGVLIDTFHLHRLFQMLESCFCHLNTVKDFSSFTMVTLSHLSQMFQNQMWIRVCHQMKSAIITPRGKDTKDDRHDIKKIITMDEWCRNYQSTACEQINQQLRKGKLSKEVSSWSYCHCLLNLWARSQTLGFADWCDRRESPFNFFKGFSMYCQLKLVFMSQCRAGSCNTSHVTAISNKKYYYSSSCRERILIYTRINNNITSWQKLFEWSLELNNGKVLKHKKHTLTMCWLVVCELLKRPW